MVETSDTSGESPVVIKKYANRRLYNTASSSYVTLDHLAQMVKDGQEFVVHDAKTGEDITRQVLTQIIVEEETKGQTMLPISFLRQLIRLYDDGMQGFVPRCLEFTMENFVRNQEQICAQMETSLGKVPSFPGMEEMARQNMALFEQALSMFTPGAGRPNSGAGNGSGATGAGAGAATATPQDDNSVPDKQADSSEEQGDEISGLRAKLAEMQDELEALARRGEPDNRQKDN